MARVLVADDAAVVRLLVSRRVRELGAEVVVAVSVASAREVDPCSLACAVLDLDLGDGLGTEVAEVLRAAAGALPVAFFTSEDAGDARTEAAAFGPVFAKPGELDDVVAWVARHVAAPIEDP